MGGLEKLTSCSLGNYLAELGVNLSKVLIRTLRLRAKANQEALLAFPECSRTRSNVFERNYLTWERGSLTG